MFDGWASSEAAGSSLDARFAQTLTMTGFAQHADTHACNALCALPRECIGEMQKLTQSKQMVKKRSAIIGGCRVQSSSSGLLRIYLLV